MKKKQIILFITIFLVFYFLQIKAQDNSKEVVKDSLSLTKNDSTGIIEYSNLKGKYLPKVKSKILWQIDLGTKLETEVLLGKSNIIVTSYDGIIYNFDFDGNKIWNYNFDEKIISKPIIVKNNLIVATITGDLYSLELNTGEVTQSIGIDDSLKVDLITTEINYYGKNLNAIVVGTNSGEIFCYSVKDLELIWENKSLTGKITTNFAINKNSLLFAKNDGNLYSIDVRTGSLNWKWNLKNKTSLKYSNPISNKNFIYITTSNGYVQKIDLLLGTTIWTRKNYKSSLSLGLSNSGKTVIVKTTDNRLVLLSAKTGYRIQALKLKFGLDKIKHRPIEWKRNYLISSDNGKIYLIDKKYRYKPLFFLGNTNLHSIQKVNDNAFIVSNIVGKIVLFSLK